MSVLSVKNLQEVVVGKNIARAATQITNPAAAGYIADGEIVVLTSTGAIYDSAVAAHAWPTNPWIQVVQRSGNELIYSAKIQGDKVLSYTGGLGSAGQEQIYHIGFNGTAGSFDVSGDGPFKVTLTMNHDDMQWSEQKQKNVTLVPKSVVSTSQQILAREISRNVMKKYVTDGIPVTAAMLNSAAAGVVTGLGVTLNVTHGSTVIQYSGPAAGVTTGSVVRIGAAAAGVDENTPVYVVTGAHPTLANAFFIEQAFAGPTNTLLPAADHGLIPAGSLGANYGIRFTGKALPFVKDFFKFKRVSFTVGMSGLGTTILTKTQDMAYGEGDGRLVAEEESFCKGFQGAVNRMTVPLPTVSFDANASTATSAVNATFADTFTTAAQIYGSVVLVHYGENMHTTTPSVKMPQTVKLFLIDNAGNQNKAANTGILTALDDYLASVPQGFAAVGTPFA